MSSTQYLYPELLVDCSNIVVNAQYGFFVKGEKENIRSISENSCANRLDKFDFGNRPSVAFNFPETPRALRLALPQETSSEKGSDSCWL